MPTPAEQAQEMERRRLARAGLNPDGTPMNPAARQPAADDDFEIDDDDDNRGGEPDDRDREIEELRAQLQAANGRAGPVQQQLSDYQRMWDEERRARERERTEMQQQIETLQGQLNERSTQITVEDLIAEEDRGDFDPKLLQLIVKTADKIAQARAPKIDARAEALAVIEQRETDRVKLYRQRVLTDPARGLHELGTLAYDPKFQEWAKEDDNDVDSVVNSLLHATSTEEVDRYAKIVAKRLAKFKESKGGKPRDPDANSRLAGHMRRGPKAKLTEAEVKEKFNEAKRLSRSSNPADRKRAQELLDEIQ